MVDYGQMESATGPTAGVNAPRRVLLGRADWMAVGDAPSVPDSALAPTPAPRTDEALPLVTRPIRLSDLAALRRVSAVHRLNQPESQLAPYSPLRAGLRASTPGMRARRPFLVACEGDRLVGFAHFAPIPPDNRWLLIALGASVGVYDAEPVWEALLATGVRSAGLGGVKRLYARSPDGSPVAPSLRALGWAPFARETVYAGYAVDIRPVNVGRPQGPADTWAMHQLYNAAVPRDVQYAEAFTSHRWDLGGRRAMTGGSVNGWLLEDGHQLIASARTTSRGDNHMLELIHHPEQPGVIPTLIDAALATLPVSRAQRVFCAVRGYQAEVASALAARGFVPVLEQELHVKYTTVAVRPAAGTTVPFHVDVRDKLPQRVPSFLHGHPCDESPI